MIALGWSTMNDREKLNAIKNKLGENRFSGTPTEYEAFNFLIEQIDMKYGHSFKRIEEAFEKIQRITEPKAQFETTVWNVRQRFDEIYEQATVARAYIPELGEEYRNG